MNNERPDPDNLLKIISKDSNGIGKLTIFFGACAGVGKTYTMLSRAREEIKDGKEVVVGIVETHGRIETKKLLEGIRYLPLLEIEHNGLIIKELDLDQAIKMDPSILIVDELAHTNPDNSRHPKRWQDVEELLENGIDVYTTLNVQHLESLNDMIASITGIRVKETIPDSFFDKADEIVLVDIPSEIILERLQEGKVYLGEFAKQRAAQHFFKIDNLIALREIALRRTAERVDALRNLHQKLKSGNKQKAIADKILVCVNSQSSSAKLIRKAKQQAITLKCTWTVLYIDDFRHYRLSRTDQLNLEKNFRLAEQLGAKTQIIQNRKIAAAIVEYAVSNSYTRIIVGKSSRSGLKRRFFDSLADKLIALCIDIDIYVVPTESQKHLIDNKKRCQTDLAEYWLTLLIILCCTLLGLLVKDWLNREVILMIYIIGIVIISAKLKPFFAITSTFISLLLFKFIFTKPYYDFNLLFNNFSDLITFIAFLLTGITISTVISQLNFQNSLSHQHQKYITALYEFSRKMIIPCGKNKIAAIAANYIGDTFNSYVTIWLPGEDGLPLYSHPKVNLGVKEESVAQWAFLKGKRAGYGTDTMPSAKGYYIPISNGNKIFGVLGIIPKDIHHTFSGEDNIMLDALILQTALALERIYSSDLKK